MPRDDDIRNKLKEIGQHTRKEYVETHQKRTGTAFAADKKMLGWSIAQRRGDRIDCANVCIGLWYNLFKLVELEFCPTLREHRLRIGRKENLWPRFRVLGPVSEAPSHI